MWPKVPSVLTNDFLFYLLICLFFYWSSICQHLAYHPVLIPSSVPLSSCHPVTPTSRPPPLPLLLVRFPELGRSLSCFVTLSDISHSFSLLSPLFPFTLFYIYYFTQEQIVLQSCRWWPEPWLSPKVHREAVTLLGPVNTACCVGTLVDERVILSRAPLPWFKSS